MTEEHAGWPAESDSLLGFLGKEVRRMRLGLGLTQAELARRAYTTQAMVSYVEGGKRPMSLDLAKGLDNAFGTDGMFERMLPYLHRYAFPTWAAPFTTLERDAHVIRVFHNSAVPSLLQTEEYAAASLRPGRPDDVEELLNARLQRQELFGRHSPPHAWFVIDEWALRRTVGTGAVMEGQYEHLLRRSSQPRTVIQVLPVGTLENPVTAGAFELLALDEGNAVLYVDGFLQGRLSADPEEIEGATRSFDLLRATALPPGESMSLIRSYV